MLTILQRAWMLPMFATLGIAACRSEPAAPLAACTGAVTGRVDGVGSAASFTWTPRCGLFAINVVAPPSIGLPSEMWRLVSDGQLIEPGVRYGEQLPGTRAEVPAMPVIRGTTYAVFLTGERSKPPVATVSWTP